MRLHRSKHFFLYSLLFTLLLFVSVEGIRIFLAKIELDRVAQKGLKYVNAGRLAETTYCERSDVLDRTIQILHDDYDITTLTYTISSSSTAAVLNSHLLLELDKADGKADCYIDKSAFATWFTWISVFNAWVGSARFYETRDIIIKSASPFLLDSHKISIQLCSNRPGYSYNENTKKCIPQDDVGMSYDGGDIARVELSYNYSIGSSVGISLSMIQLQSVYIGTTECFRVGCSSGINFVFSKPISVDYTLEVMSVEDGRRIIHCSNGKQVKATDTEPYGACSEKAVWISISIPPENLTYTLRFSDQTIEGKSEPTYTPSYPDGPKCLTCWGASIEIAIP